MKKTSKKLMTLTMVIITVISLFTVPCGAANVGDVIGYAQPTDIVATINGYQLESYNVNGLTYICVEDLRYYGFNVTFDMNTKTLAFSRSSEPTTIDPQHTNPDFYAIGTNQGFKNTLYTDIVTYANNEYVTSSNINGKTIGLIGAGKISQRMVDIANIFNMPILCYTEHPENHEDLIRKGVKFVELDELLQNSDIINVSVPLTNKTNNLISRDKVELLKKNATFINTSRTGVTDVQALVEFADKNPSFYLGLDIDVGEYTDLLFKRRNNVVVTPHIAGCTDDAIKRQYIECAENIVNVLEKRKQEKNIEGR